MGLSRQCSSRDDGGGNRGERQLRRRPNTIAALVQVNQEGLGAPEAAALGLTTACGLPNFLHAVPRSASACDPATRCWLNPSSCIVAVGESLGSGCDKDVPTAATTCDECTEDARRTQNGLREMDRGFLILCCSFLAYSAPLSHSWHCRRSLDRPASLALDWPKLVQAKAIAGLPTPS
jgi:hypothetical protein